MAEDSDENEVSAPHEGQQGGEEEAKEASSPEDSDENEVSAPHEGQQGGEEEAKEASSPSSPPKSPMISPHLEMVLRITMAILLAYCLSYATIPKAIPPSARTFTGFVGVIVATVMPSYIYSIGLLMPTLVVGFLFGFGGATMLLATAASVGTGPFVAVYAIWSLWASSLSYGPHASSVSGLGRLALVISTLLTMGSYGNVVNGIGGTYDIEKLDEPVNVVEDGPVLALVKTIWQDGIIETGDVKNFTIPKGDFAGQTAYVEADSDTVYFSLPGGMWWVKGFWTWSGLTNPHAVMRNALIGMLWGLFCACLVPILPPWRTIRKFISRGLLPNVMRDTAREITTAGEGEGQEDEALLSRLVGYGSTLNGGKIAFPTAYEWRLLDIHCCAPPTCPHVKLQQLAATVDLAVKKALALDAVPPYPENSRVWCRKVTKALKDCASDLQAGSSGVDEETIVDQGTKDEEHQPGNDSFRRGYRTLETCSSDLQSGSIGDQEAIEYQLGNDPFRLGYSAEQIRSKTNAFLDSMTKKGERSTIEEDAKKWGLSVKPLFVPSLQFLTAWFPLPSTLKRFWSIPKFFHCFNFALGFTALLCMSVYWKGYREFELNPSPDPSSPLDLNSDPLQNFGSWNLITYVISVMPTVEGSFKSAAIRTICVALAGLNVWLALLATSGNIYGMVAWLTITAFIALLFAVDSDPVKARAGRSKDFGSGPFFFILTNTIIGLGYAVGKGSRDELVASRVVASIIGVLFAFVVVIIPPAVRGGSPTLAKKIVAEANSTLASCLRLLLARDSAALKELEKSWDTESEDMLSEATYLLQDASLASLASRYRIYHVDPKLSSQLKSLTVTASVLHYMIAFTFDAAKDDAIMSAFEDGSEKRRKILKLIDQLEDHAAPVPSSKPTGEALLDDSNAEEMWDMTSIDEQEDHAAPVPSSKRTSEASADSNAESLEMWDTSTRLYQYASILAKRLRAHETVLADVQYVFWAPRTDVEE